MGNFHRISSSCARVVWREYLPPVVRWRYDFGEEWQEIEADDYATEKEKGKCQSLYHAFGTLTNMNLSWEDCKATGY